MVRHVKVVVLFDGDAGRVPFFYCHSDRSSIIPWYHHEPEKRFQETIYPFLSSPVTWKETRDIDRFFRDHLQSTLPQGVKHSERYFPSTFPLR